MTKIFDTARNLLGEVFLTLSFKLLKEGDQLMMAMFFAQRVILEKTTFDEVPATLKKPVADILIESGLDFLVPDEYKTV